MVEHPPHIRRARALRQVGNSAENRLWHYVRNRQVSGVKFVRQWPVGPYFADFACRERRLVVEIDGSQHIGKAYDRRRDQFMQAQGWSVAWFWYADVLETVSKGRFLACKDVSSALPMLTYLMYAALRFSQTRLFGLDSNLLKQSS